MRMLCVGGPLDGRHLDVPTGVSAVVIPSWLPTADDDYHERYFPTRLMMPSGATISDFTGVERSAYCWEMRLRHSSIELPEDTV